MATPNAQQNIPEVITSEEELNAILAKEQEINEEGKGEGAAAEGAGGEGGEGEGNTIFNQEGEGEGEGKGKKPGADSDDGGEGEGDGEGAQEYPTALHYLNERFGIGMNLENLPEDINEGQVAEAIGDLMDRMTTGFNKKIEEQATVNEILKDKEVADFIEAKKDGKTLRDYAMAYATTAEGMDDEVLIRKDLKVQYPGMGDEKIDSIISGYKEKDIVGDMANAARQRMKANDQAAEAQRQREKEIADKQDAQERARSVEELGTFLRGVNNVYGVPLTDDMRAQVFVAATQLDEDGDTYLDKALQSNEGLVLATLGILHLKQLIGGKRSIEGNKTVKKIIDNLFDDPANLQSGKGGHNDGGADDKLIDTLANQF